MPVTLSRAYIAFEEDAPVDASKEHKLRVAVEDFKAKLLISNIVLPDPFSLQTGWVNEKDSIKLWPSLYRTDIVQYLNAGNQKQLVHKLLNEYKQGKVYR